MCCTSAVKASSFLIFLQLWALCFLRIFVVMMQSIIQIGITVFPWRHWCCICLYTQKLTRSNWVKKEESWRKNFKPCLLYHLPMPYIKQHDCCRKLSFQMLFDYSTSTSFKAYSHLYPWMILSYSMDLTFCWLIPIFVPSPRNINFTSFPDFRSNRILNSVHFLLTI